MVAVPLLSGIVAGPAAEFIETAPLNLEPTPVDAKIAGKGQLKPPPGAISTASNPGIDRGGIVWNGVQLRVFGANLCSVSPPGAVTVIGNVDDGKRCEFDYGFDRLGIWSNCKLWYYDGASISQVTDVDLGNALDGIWIGGYFMSTDGQYVIVTELADPTQVKTLKYGSAETDPDPITGLIRYREEAYVLGRNTIQIFRNVGGNGFPFETVLGGTIPFGCVGPRAKCLFGDGYAFVGSGRGESLNVFAGGQGQAVPFGSKPLCDALAAVGDETDIEIEQRDYGNEKRLVVHLPTESWCFLSNASRTLGEPIWFRLQSAPGQPYRLRNMVLANGKRWVGDSQGAAFGYLDDATWSHFGDVPEWQFEAGMLYNGGQPFRVDSAELIGLPGRGSGKGSIFMSMTKDGQAWSMERAMTVELGDRTKRLQFRPHARFANYMGFRFRGRGVALPGIAALEVAAVNLGPGG